MLMFSMFNLRTWAQIFSIHTLGPAYNEFGYIEYIVSGEEIHVIAIKVRL